MADLTDQLAKYGDTDNTLLLKIAKATQAVAGGEAGDATAANQTTQITAEQAILAKLPTVGTAGTASANVITVQGIASGTPAPTKPSGTVADNGVSADNPVIVGGVAVTGFSYAPSYTVGDVAKLPLDAISGGVLGHIRALTRAGDAVSADPKQLTTSSGATPATADATVFTLAAGEKGVIQNLSADAPLAYKYGASASTSSFNGILQACAVQDDGKGGIVVIDDWIGAVSVAKITGTARYIAYKLS